MTETTPGFVWVFCLHLGAAGSMATVGLLNLQWWRRARSERFLATAGLLCWSVALTLVVGALGLAFPETGVFQVVVPLRAVLIGITAALFISTLGGLVRLPALRIAVLVEVIASVAYVVLGVTGDLAYSFATGSPWPRIQPVGKACVAISAILFLVYAATAFTRLAGVRRRQLGAATVSVMAALAVPAIADFGWLTEATTSLWTLPIAVLLGWWCSERVLVLQGSLVSASAGRLQAERAAQYQARHDQLTGLPNRHGVAEALQLLLDADPGTSVIVTALHVDRLEQVRAAADSHAADLVLRAIASHLVSVLPAEALVSRVQEATFAIVTPLPQGSSAADLTERAERTIALLRRTTDLPRDLEVSVGIAVSRPTSTAVQLLQEAGTAVVAAERQPGRVQVYRPELTAEMVHRADITRQLCHAIDRGEFELHYQPIVATRTLDRVAVEALVRWRYHGRLHPPLEWIPIAEQQGLMPAIGLHVLRLAARDAPAIGCPVTVNVSASQLADPDFIGNVLSAMHGLPAHAISLEVTESCVMADLEQARTALTTLRNHGIVVAIDDFGTEYSSLSRLASVPFDVLKVDRSFVIQVMTPHGRAIVTAIQALARALGKTTVAEGVETEEELRSVTEIGCDRVQGFLTGRPVPLAELLLPARPVAVSTPGVA